MNSHLRILLSCLVIVSIGLSVAVADEGKNESGNNGCYTCPGNISADVHLSPCMVYPNLCTRTADLGVKVCITNKSEIPICATQTEEIWTLILPGGVRLATTAVPLYPPYGFDLSNPIQPEQTVCFWFWVTVDLDPLDDPDWTLPNEIKLYKEFCIEDAIENCELTRCGFKDTATWLLGNF
jgi:hypothetical protein